MEPTTRSTPRQGQNSPESARADDRELRDLDLDGQYDLLTAALLGVAVGAVATLLIGAGVRSRPQPHPIRKALKRGSKRAGRMASALSPEVLRDQVQELMSSARDSVTDTVEAELKDLRRSIRRQRRRLGL